MGSCMTKMTKKKKKKKTIYLCGPIEGCTDKECMAWREEVIKKLGKKYNFLNPMVRDYRNIGNVAFFADSVVEADIKDIDASDIILALANNSSVGTSMEIFYAYSKKKYVIIACNKKRPSPWLLYHSDVFFDHLEDAIELLDKGGKNL